MLFSSKTGPVKPEIFGGLKEGKNFRDGMYLH